MGGGVIELAVLGGDACDTADCRCRFVVGCLWISALLAGCGMIEIVAKSVPPFIQPSNKKY